MAVEHWFDKITKLLAYDGVTRRQVTHNPLPVRLPDPFLQNLTHTIPTLRHGPPTFLPPGSTTAAAPARE